MRYVPRILALALLILAAARLSLAAEDVLEHEQIGGLHYGDRSAVVTRILGRAPSMSAEILEAATGMWVQTWRYGAVDVGMSSAKKGGPKTVVSVNVKAPFPKMKTARGIHIGSTEAEVRKAYAALIDAPSSDARRIVVGSVYGGLIFQLRGGKVSQMFLGAAAE